MHATHAPLTRPDLDEALGELRDELKADNAALRDEFKADNAALRNELHDGLRDVSLQIADSAARTTNVVIEHVRDLIRSMDDRYRDLPSRVRVLEDRADAHDRSHRESGPKR